MINNRPLINIKDMSQINFKTHMLFRCTTLEYANRFLNSGNIRFGLPQEWIDYYKTNGDGRGDLLEGSFASIKEFDDRPMNFYKSIRPNVIITEDSRNRHLYFQSKDVLNLRTFCLFGLNDNLFTEQVEAEDRKKYPSGIISKKYFEDFSDVTKDNYDSLQPSEKPVLLMINNPKKFFERLRKKLLNLGLTQNEFIIHPVGYADKEKQFLCGDVIPGELFIKDITFNYQSEIRVVITSTRKEIKELFNNCNGIIDIGHMKDIADISDYYFEDFSMQLRGNTFYYSLSKPIVTTVADPFVFMSVIHQALRDELPGDPLSIEGRNKYIAPFIESLECGYNITFNLKELEFKQKDGSITWKMNNIWETLYNHGCNYYNEKRYRESVDSYSKAISIDPSRAAAWYNRGVSYYALEMYDEMLSDMDKAIELDPKNMKYITERAIQIERLKKC